jgi:hypothetical protein
MYIVTAEPVGSSAPQPTGPSFLEAEVTFTISQEGASTDQPPAQAGAASESAETDAESVTPPSTGDGGLVRQDGHQGVAVLGPIALGIAAALAALGAGRIVVKVQRC